LQLSVGFVFYRIAGVERLSASGEAPGAWPHEVGSIEISTGLRDNSRCGRGEPADMADAQQIVQMAELLKRCDLFCDLDQSDLETLAGFARRQKFAAGTPIFHAGDAGESLMGILSGTVRILRPSAEGGEIIIADFGPGDLFGEIAVLDGSGRSADAVAVTNCEMIVLERRDLMPFLMRRPELSLALLKLICGKLRIADERSSDFLFLDLRSRLAKALLRLCVPPTNMDRLGKTSLTQGELARIVGGTRPNVNRQLKEWEREGVVEMKKGWIFVRDRERLAEIAGDSH
jgi:CRP/FNR family cyclic AMP-dependent transcriptional regulator